MDVDKFPLTGSMPVDDMRTFKFIGFYPATAPLPVRCGVSRLKSAGRSRFLGKLRSRLE
jgi:hypothetical protein